MARIDAPAGPRIAGKIARVVSDKGFGFLDGKDGTEYFFHFSTCSPGVWDEICQKGKGLGVTFDPAKTEKGWRALAIRIE